MARRLHSLICWTASKRAINSKPYKANSFHHDDQFHTTFSFWQYLKLHSAWLSSCTSSGSSENWHIWERLQVLRYLKAVSATRNNCDQSDLRISCAILVGACKFNDCIEKHKIDVALSRLRHLRCGHCWVKRGPYGNFWGKPVFVLTNANLLNKS